MAKRFYDTEKFEDPWYRALPPKAKLLWEYMLCACNCSGIWKADFGIASYCIGVKVTFKEVEKYLGTRCVHLKNGSIFIPKFLVFQYAGMDLENTKNGVVRGIHKALGYEGLKYPECLRLDTLSHTLSGDPLEGHRSRIRIRSDLVPIDIEIDMLYIDVFNTLWRQYPNKQGRKDAMRHFKASVKTEERTTLITKALENYLDHVADKEPQYIKNGSTWFYQWEDWIEPPITDHKKDAVDSQKQRERNLKLEKMGLA